MSDDNFTSDPFKCPYLPQERIEEEDSFDSESSASVSESEFLESSDIEHSCGTNGSKNQP